MPPIVRPALDAALFIGFAFVLDARWAHRAHDGTTQRFGVEFDSLADVVSFGVAPAISRSSGDSPRSAHRVGGGFLFVAAAAVRCAVQHSVRHAGQRVLRRLPSPTAASVPAATVFAIRRIQTNTEALAVLAMMIVPALLMVSTIRYRSFKTFDLQSRRSYPVLFLLALGSRCSRHNRRSSRGDGLHVSRFSVHRLAGIGAQETADSASHAGARRTVEIPARLAGTGLA
jgi:phosphatidylserine synthase